ncbi:putative S-adenosyl-L-methionine-dependent methyltransferases superfamily protein [Hibiscus syriacus]|uniref:S-adenosyl-L-methionine-dependent methyltransferases superfamily protein n=1 Tax=Hibiscus syriacus TaxID=106335 RepID=A0A6A2YC30_HIBSY|nr:putative S-adenosyl-L-methionine-dependent methyltransferases superfamily protein [Hibiscus syriacus]
MAGMRLSPEDSSEANQHLSAPHQQQFQTGREVASDDDRSVAADSWSIKSDYGSTLDDEQRHADAAESSHPLPISVPLLTTDECYHETSSFLLVCSDKDEPDADAMTSMLGLQSYWDAAYLDELANFREHGHVGEIWFGTDVMDTVISWTKSLCIDVSQGHIMNQVGEAKSHLLNRMISICLPGVYLTLARAMVWSFRNFLSKGTLKILPVVMMRATPGFRKFRIILVLPLAVVATFLHIYLGIELDTQLQHCYVPQPTAFYPPCHEITPNIAAVTTCGAPVINSTCPICISVDFYASIYIFLEMQPLTRSPFKYLNILLGSMGVSVGLQHNSPTSESRSRKPFRLFNYLMDEEGFEDLVVSSIQSEKKISLIEEDIQQKQGVDSEVLTELKNFRAELWKLHKIQEQIWFQYSRTNWIVDGDRNTKYFHTCATIRNKRNALLALNFKGETVEDPTAIMAIVKEIYLEHNQFLEKEFSEEEVWDAVNSCGSNKALEWEHGVNHTFITLIPKISNIGGLDDFRPISLVGGLYKILSKCLSRRLRSCISDLISPSQFALSRPANPGLFLIANEGIDFWRKNGLKGIMKEMGFGSRWIGWISKCITSATVSVLVNGVPTRKFQWRGVFGMLNLKKCKLFGVNLKEEEIKDWAAMIGCSVGSFPSEYLGLPLGPHRNSNILWDPVVQSFNKRLAGWKGSSLSLAGRLVLIKSVLSSLPILFVNVQGSSFSLQDSKFYYVKFLWGGGDGKKKIHWVSWSDVCKPKIEGGLGVPNLNVVNRALLEKWAWRFAIEREAVWREMLCIKYKLEPSLMQFDSKVSPKFSWMWRDMLSNHYKADSLGCSIRGKYSYKIGNERNIRFWQDNWAMDHPLMVLFPRIFSIAVNKAGRLFQFGEFSSGGWIWNVQLRRELNDWEFEQWANLMAFISDFSISADAADGLFWKGNGEGVFTVKSCVNLSYSGSPDSEEAKFWKSNVWRGLCLQE